MNDRIRKFVDAIKERRREITIAVGTAIVAVGAGILASRHTPVPTAPDDSVDISPTMINEHGQRYFIITEK